MLSHYCPNKKQGRCKKLKLLLLLLLLGDALLRQGGCNEIDKSQVHCIGLFHK